MVGDQADIANVINYINYLPGQAGKQSLSTQEKLKFVNSFLSIPLEIRKQIGHQLEDFIKSCTFEGLECSIDNR